MQQRDQAKNSVSSDSFSIEEYKSVSKPSVSENDKPFVLLVNDSPFLLHAVSDTLKAFNMRVDTATNGFEAYHQVTKKPRNHYAAIVLDINMPIMDGKKACTKISAYLRGEDLGSMLQIENIEESAEEIRDLSLGGRKILRADSIVPA